LAILENGGMHVHREQAALRVDEHMALAPGEVFAAIEAADAAHERLA
jgi:hypothetical protein